ncbi:Transmembrane domain-containing protein [Spironucleus salmonicida]|uniref:Transmembrane domain-containing protein n=1 Tax=Spironucleus salmonicida TaxID=348837 RepID=A0A9P8LNL9_9EUKA|nr:Transmembrane domain-containing protein [Spironucleus salmonicida]
MHNNSVAKEKLQPIFLVQLSIVLNYSTIMIPMASMYQSQDSSYFNYLVLQFLFVQISRCGHIQYFFNDESIPSIRFYSYCNSLIITLFVSTILTIVDVKFSVFFSYLLAIPFYIEFQILLYQQQYGECFFMQILQFTSALMLFSYFPTNIPLQIGYRCLIQLIISLVQRFYYVITQDPVKKMEFRLSKIMVPFFTLHLGFFIGNSILTISLLCSGDQILIDRLQCLLTIMCRSLFFLPFPTNFNYFQTSQIVGICIFPILIIILCLALSYFSKYFSLLYMFTLLFQIIPAISLQICYLLVLPTNYILLQVQSFVMIMLTSYVDSLKSELSDHNIYLVWQCSGFCVDLFFIVFFFNKFIKIRDSKVLLNKLL